MSHGWTPERRARQAEAIRRWKPWESSTGPRTEAGKAVTRRNASKGGVRPLFRLMTRALMGQRRWCSRFLDTL